jgi:hypothetical protein
LGHSDVPQGPRKKPLKYVDVYVNDFIGLTQGSVKTQDYVRDTLLAAVDQVFRPAFTDEGQHRQEPSSTKKLGKGNGYWSTQKKILGWFLDTVAGTIQLPQRWLEWLQNILDSLPHTKQRIGTIQLPQRRLEWLQNILDSLPRTKQKIGTIQLPQRRLERLQNILDSLPRTKRRIAIKKWHKVLGELRSMVLAVPGLRGLFSLLQEGLCHQEQGRMKLSKELHNFLDDIRWVVPDLGSHPKQFHELVPTPLATIGASNACAVGMGGIFFVPTTEGYISYLKREKFPKFITSAVVSWDNPTGTVTNSDLELAATVAHHDVITANVDICERTIYMLTDNTPAAGWQTKGSTTTTGAAAYLLWQQALHQRHYHYHVRLSHIRGDCNIMVDDCSCLWHLTDEQLLAHFRAELDLS